MEIDLGIFEKFWNGNPNHLPFLDLDDDTSNKNWNLEISLNLINELYSNNGKELFKEGIFKLLNGENSRPQLVACVAILKLEKSEQKDFLNILWKEIEQGAWLKPQLLALLSIIDDDFIKKGIEKSNFKNLDSLSKEDAEWEIFQKLSKSKKPYDDKSGVAQVWKDNLLKLAEKGLIKIN